MPDDVPAFRTIIREYPDDDSRLIAVVKNTGVVDPEADEATLDRFEAEMDERRARELDDPAS